MVQNWPKMVKNGQNCPKIGEINRGGPPENPNESQKYRKNGPTVQYENAPKRSEMAKNQQKSANIVKKVDFPTTTSPKRPFP